MVKVAEPYVSTNATPPYCEQRKKRKREEERKRERRKGEHMQRRRKRMKRDCQMYCCFSYWYKNKKNYSKVTGKGGKVNIVAL